MRRFAAIGDIIGGADRAIQHLLLPKSDILFASMNLIGIAMTLGFNPDDVEIPTGHFIGGRFVTAGDSVPVHRPSDRQAFADCAIASAEIVDDAVSTAVKTLKDSGWGRCRPRERLTALHRWADLIEQEAETLGRLEALSSTRPISQVIAGDIPVVAEQIRFFAEFADKEGGELAPTSDEQLGMIRSEPIGVVGAITPWNFPLSMACWKLGPALAAGNAVVLKPSEMTPFSTLMLAALSVKAGIPAGLVNVVLGTGEITGRAITGHPDIGKISFTGSTRAGAAIMANVAACGIRPMTLELGGKSPQLVFADADLDLAAASVTNGIIANAGQVCVAGSRLLVEKSVQDELLAKIQARMSNIAPGPTWDAATQYAPIISETQISRIETIVAAALEKGADLRLGGTRLEASPAFYHPTILSGVDAASPAVVEEIFGPVLTVQGFESEEEAVALADHRSYGLCAGVYSRDLSRTMRVAQSLQSGTVWVNRYGRSRDHILPTGGYKRSGIGKDLGRDAYKSNRRNKAILVDL